MQPTSVYTLLARERARFARFSVVGGLGFLVDAGVLQLVITVTDLSGYAEALALRIQNRPRMAASA